MAHVATGLIGEHMVDYFELNRLGGSFMHDSNQRFPNRPLKYQSTAAAADTRIWAGTGAERTNDARN